MSSGIGTIPLVEKAFAYVTHRERLLVFKHLGIPEAGVQVPAGTLEPGEAPAAAARREAEEETGLRDFDDAVPLGVESFDARPFGRHEVHRRHFFHLPFSGRAGEPWRHQELHASDGAPPVTFELSWIPVRHAAAVLSFEHGARLEALFRVMRP
jgi:8-oxo-dGTP pyrophosphatase MutT (NUDIX family)